MTPLYRELHRWASLPFIWGESDCITCVCDWIMQVRGVDPAENVRGTYDSRGSCQRETGFFRNPTGVVDHYFSAAGLERTTEQRPGDVAIILARDADGRVSPCGAIWMGSAWGCKGPNGTTTINRRAASPLLCADGTEAIWSVGYEA